MTTLHVLTGGQRPEPIRRGHRHGYTCLCQQCQIERAALGPKVCECQRPGPVDDHRCVTCGRAARPQLKAAA